MAKLSNVQHKISLLAEIQTIIIVNADQTLEPLVYRHLFVNDSNQILLTRMVYLDRQELLQKMCHNYMQDFKHRPNVTEYREMFDHLLVDKKHRLLYCYVPKVCLVQDKCLLFFPVISLLLHGFMIFIYVLNFQNFK